MNRNESSEKKAFYVPKLPSNFDSRSKRAMNKIIDYIGIHSSVDLTASPSPTPTPIQNKYMRPSASVFRFLLLFPAGLENLM